MNSVLDPPIIMPFQLADRSVTANLYDKIRRKPEMKAAKKPQQKQKLGLRVVVFIYSEPIRQNSQETRNEKPPEK